MSTQGPSDRTQVNAAVQALQLRAWSHATTIRLARVKNDRETGLNSASGVLLEFGTRAVIATAWHVLEKYARLRNDGHELYIVCDNMPIVEPRTAWRDPPNDIAFLDVPPKSRDGLEAVPYRPSPLIWPAPQVQAGDVVAVCGFPKIIRRDDDEIMHGDLNLLVSVARAGEFHFMLQIEIERLVQVGETKIPETTTDFGGVSGGPVFLADNGANPLVGLVSECGENLPLWRVAALHGAPVDIESRPSTPL